MASHLQCEPFFQDWSAAGVFHVYGAEIVRSSVYDVELVDESCAEFLDNVDCYSDPLQIQTSKWGDVFLPFEDQVPPQPDFADIAALVSKFKGSILPLKSHARLQPNVPDLSQPVDFADISKCVDGFLQRPYPFPGPTACQ